MRLKLRTKTSRLTIAHVRDLMSLQLKFKVPATNPNKLAGGDSI
jgi:hypothetical protein